MSQRETQVRRRTSSSNTTLHWSGEGEAKLVKTAALVLDEIELAKLWWALYREFGNDERGAPIWAAFREATGDDWFAEIADLGVAYGKGAWA